MKRLPVVAVLVALGLSVISAGFARAEGITIRDGSYAAIAYSPSTKAFGYAYDYNSRCAAEQAALSHCQHEDARIVAWVSGGFAALVRTDDGSWGSAADWGEGSSNLRAQDKARNASGVTNTRTVLILSSDGQYIYRP